MDNWIYDLLTLPEECQVEESLPKQFLTDNFELSSGEKNLLNYSIEAMSIVGAIGPSYGGVPSYEADALSMESVVILLVETKGGKFAKEASKIADMLQKHLPQYALIGLSDGEKACVSIASKCKSAEDETVLEIKESFLTPLFSADAMDDLVKEFSFETINKENLNTLWNNYCEVVARVKL